MRYAWLLAVLIAVVPVKAQDGAAVYTAHCASCHDSGVPRVHREQTFHGSFWGNYTDLSEVMALATENKIRHSIKLFKFDEINENLDLLRKGAESVTPVSHPNQMCSYYNQLVRERR